MLKVTQSEEKSDTTQCQKRGDKSWIVYLVQCADGSLYTGITTDLSRRLRQHNGELAGGARYTRNRRPVSLAWCQPAADRSAAGRAEYCIRRLSRAEKLALTAAFSD